MPSIRNYEMLKAQVIQALERETDTTTPSLFDGWLSLCESEYAPILRAPWAVRFAEFTYNETDAEPFAYLPPTYTAMGILVNLDSTLYDPEGLQPISPSEQVSWRRSSGPAKVYMVSGYTVRIFPSPGIGTALPMWMEYYSRQEPLIAEKPNDTNDVLINAPMIYFAGVMREASMHYGDPGGYQLWSSRFFETMEKINAMDGEWRRGAHARVNVRR